MATPKLSKREIRLRLFAAYYAGESKLDGVDAARKAGFAGTAKALKVSASRALNSPLVQKLLAGKLSAAEASQQEILLLLANHMRGSIEPFLEFDDFGEASFNLLAAKQAGKLGLIKKLKITRTKQTKGEEVLEEQVSYELALHDPQSAAVQLGKIAGMYVEKFQIVDERPPGDMSDEDWLEFYLKHHIGRDVWLPGVRRLYEAGKLGHPAKQIESKPAEEH